MVINEGTHLKSQASNRHSGGKKTIIESGQGNDKAAAAKRKLAESPPRGSQSIRNLNEFTTMWEAAKLEVE